MPTNPGGSPKFKFALTSDDPIDLSIAHLCDLIVEGDSHYLDSPRGLCNVSIPGWEIFAEFVPGPDVPLLKWMRVIKESEGQVFFHWVNTTTFFGEYEIDDRNLVFQLQMIGL